MLLPFPLLMQWCSKRQKYLGWTSQTLAEKSGVPISTISRIKADDYLDCKYSTIRSLLIALIGGTTDEWLCNAQVDQEIQAARSTELESENAALKERLASIDAQHRQDCGVSFHILYQVCNKPVRNVTELLQLKETSCKIFDFIVSY
jgi:transcriptional regulator with XRE-family HTH domain